MKRGERMYRRLLRFLLPGDLREEAEEELVEVFTELHANARRRGVSAVGGLWARTVADLAVTRIAHRREAKGPRGSWAGAVAGAWRSIVRNPRERAVEVVTVGLGVSAAVVVGVLIRDVLVSPLPYESPGELFRLRELDEEAGTWWPSRLNFEDWREAAAPSVALVGATPPAPQPVLVGDRAVRARVAEFSADLFSVLGVEPVAGRLAAPDEQRGRAPAVALVSERFWREELGGGPVAANALGVGTGTLDVVGVLPGNFGFLADGGGWGDSDVWIPMERVSDDTRRMSHGIHVVARGRPGAALAEVDAELDRMATRVTEAHGEETHAHSVLVTSLEDDLLGPAQRPLRFLLVGAFGVLIVASLNLAGARLVSGLGREREFAVRRALGAGRAQLVVHLLAEAALMAVPSAVAGLAMAGAALALARPLDPGALPRLASVQIDAGAALLAVGIALAVAAMASAGPALLLSRDAALGSVSRAGRSGTRRGVRMAWDGVIALQAAMTVALLVGTGLTLRSLAETLGEDIGYDPAPVRVIEVSLPEGRFPDVNARRAWLDQALEAARSVRGVEAVSVTDVLPHVTQARISGTTVPGEGDEWMWAGVRTVDSDFFSVLGIPSLQGSALPANPGDGVLVDRSIADRLFRGRPALGREVRSSQTGVGVSIAGVVGAVREWSLPFGEIGAVYVDYRGVPDLPVDLYLLARVAEAGASPVAELRAAVAGVDQAVPVSISPLEARLAETLGSRRLVLALIGAFALLGLFLAGIGIYGVVAYVARRRRAESGLRLALGASPADLRGSTLGIGLRPTGVGAVVGVGLSLLGAGVAGSLYAELATPDPATMGGAALIVVLAGFVAGWLPAYRAGKTDPIVALRAE